MTSWWTRGIVVWALGVAACGGSENNGTGGVGGPCIQGQCYGGLVCIVGTCSYPGGSGPSSMSGPTGEDPSSSGSSGSETESAPTTSEPTTSTSTDPVTSTTNPGTSTDPGTSTEPDTTTTTGETGVTTNTNTNTNTDPSTSTTDGPGCGGDACEQCGCEQCSFQHETCQADEGCKAIQECVKETGCVGFDCLFACSAVADLYGGIGGESSTLSLNLVVCREDACPGVCGV